MGLANGQGRGVQLAGFDAETTSSAIAGRRLGAEAPHESGAQAHTHGAD
jgi:hypothetical protein